MNILSVFQTQPSPNLIVFFGSSTLGTTCVVVSDVPLIDSGLLECTMTTDLPRPIGYQCCPYQLA